MSNDLRFKMTVGSGLRFGLRIGSGSTGGTGTANDTPEAGIFTMLSEAPQNAAVEIMEVPLGIGIAAAESFAEAISGLLEWDSATVGTYSSFKMMNGDTPYIELSVYVDDDTVTPRGTILTYNGASWHGETVLFTENTTASTLTIAKWETGFCIFCDLYGENQAFGVCKTVGGKWCAFRCHNETTVIEFVSLDVQTDSDPDCQLKILDAQITTLVPFVDARTTDYPERLRLALSMQDENTATTGFCTMNERLYYKMGDVFIRAD